MTAPPESPLPPLSPLDRPGTGGGFAAAAEGQAGGPISLGLAPAGPTAPAPSPASYGSGFGAPLPAGEGQPLNLARRPFVNSRPVARVAIFLWVLGVALLIANVALFIGYLNSSQVTRDQLAAQRSQVERENADVAKLDSQIGSLGLAQQNHEVAFLNHMIEQRVFSWSLLFDRLAEVLPNGVRLRRLTPADAHKDLEEALRSGRDLRPRPVTLSATCEAKSDEAMLRFVDNLFAHPAFAEPNLLNEERMETTNLVKFEVVVQYRPEVAAAVARAGGATDGADGEAMDDAAAAGPTGEAPAKAAGPATTVAGSLPERPASAAGAGLVRVAPPGTSAGAKRRGAKPAPGGGR